MKNISAYFCVNSFVFYIGEFGVGGHSSWNFFFFFEFLKFFVVAPTVILWFYSHYSRCIDLGNTDSINLVLYLCFIVFIL